MAIAIEFNGQWQKLGRFIEWQTELRLDNEFSYSMEIYGNVIL